MDSSDGLRSRGAVNRGVHTHNLKLGSHDCNTHHDEAPPTDSSAVTSPSPPMPSVSKNQDEESDWLFFTALALAAIGIILFSWGIYHLLTEQLEASSSHHEFPYTCTIDTSPVYLSHHQHQVRHSNQVTFEFTMEHCERLPPGMNVANTVFQGNLRPFFRADGGDHWSLFDHVEEGSLSDKEYELDSNPRFRRRDFHIAESKRCGKRLGPTPNDGKECVFIHFRLVENTPRRPKGTSERHNYV